MRKTSLLAGAALLLGAYTATAAEDYTCGTPPTCAELGYDQSVSDCSGKKTLKCPFDKTKVFCAGDCESEGYRLDLSSGSGFLLSVCCVGQTKVTCPYNSQYFKCEGEAPEFEPVLPEKGCPAGEYSSEEACTKCQYGSLPGSKSGCVRCGTYSECNGSNGGRFCLMCNKVDKL